MSRYERNEKRKRAQSNRFNDKDLHCVNARYIRFLFTHQIVRREGQTLSFQVTSEMIKASKAGFSPRSDLANSRCRWTFLF